MGEIVDSATPAMAFYRPARKLCFRPARLVVRWSGRHYSPILGMACHIKLKREWGAVGYAAC